MKMSKTLGNTIDPMVIINGSIDNNNAMKSLQNYSIKPSTHKTPVDCLLTTTKDDFNILETITQKNDIFLQGSSNDLIAFGSDSLRMALLNCSFMVSLLIYNYRVLTFLFLISFFIHQGLLKSKL